MLRVTAYYPYAKGARFDFDYYTTKHVEMFRDAFGAAGIERLTVEKGVGGAAPGSPPVYLAVLNVTVRDADRFRELFAANIPKVLADMPNYTDVQPALQFGEVVTEK